MPKKSDASKANKSLKAHSPRQARAQKTGRVEWDGSNDKAFDSSGRQAGSGKKSKDGCLPKLLMLLLPFTAVGVYFFTKL